MEEAHRNIIQRNHVKLSQTVDLDLLYPVLLSKEVVFYGEIEKIKAKYHGKESVAQEFFLLYTRRGPKAFQILIDSLLETGHISEAKLLEERSRSPDFPYDGNCASRRSSSDVEPFPMTPSPKHMTYGRSRSNPPSENASPKLSVRYEREVTMEDLPPLTLQVEEAKLYNNGVSMDECYQMMSRPRGFALVINNIEFDGDPDATRHGAEQDSENLATILELLHFQVTVRHNVHKTALLKAGGILDTFLAQFLTKDVDCCIVAVMSHGEEGYFLTSNAEHHLDPHANRVSLNREFLPRFNNHYPALQKKPKIFFIQACRGDQRDRGVRRTAVDSRDPEKSDSGSESSPSLSIKSRSSSSSDSERRIPSFEDFLVCQSTVPGFVANRDTQRGTWYIYSLCRELAAGAHDTEITKILQRVGRCMRCLSSEYGEKQMSSFVNTGFHFDLYFNPGLFGS